MMNLKCLFGHRWHGCKCNRCNKTRDKEHRYVSMLEYVKICSVCGKKDYTQAVNLLVTYAVRGDEIARFPISAMEKVIEIGKNLNDIGGISLMTGVYGMFSQQTPIHARGLNELWNGIGEWNDCI